jgi:hypothetical protein
LEEITPNLPSDNYSGSAIVSSTKFKTGGWSFLASSGNKPRGKVFASTTQIRAGVFLNHGGAVSGQAVLLNVGSSFDIWVQWNVTTGNLELYVNTTLQASVAPSAGGFSTSNTWFHLGIACKADAATGFVSFYIDGVLRLTFSGNTGTGITRVCFGGNNNAIGLGFSTAPYWDDFYVDDTVGEADAAPPSPRFPFLLPNGAGNYTNWSVNTGTNSAAVDDTGAPDDDTTYVYATASGVKDSYALTNTTAGVTVPAGYSIEAVIPIAWARKTDAGTASTLKVGTRLSATDVVGSAQTLATSYGPVWERQTTKPGGGTWTESDIDSAEIYLESAGSY